MKYKLLPFQKKIIDMIMKHPERKLVVYNPRRTGMKAVREIIEKEYKK